MTHRVVVVGAGVIGLAVAWRCAQRGLEVSLVDPSPGHGASRVAAGMLAPVTELHYGEQPLLALNLASAARYPDFVTELERLTGCDVGYRRTGAVVAAWDRADLKALNDLHDLATALGLDSRLISGRELRAIEPSLATGLAGGVVAPGDHQVDNRALHRALATAAEAAGVASFAAPVETLLVTNDTAHGVRIAGRRTLSADTTVLAAGAWTSTLPGLPAGALPPVRPVKGQTIRLRRPEATRLDRVVRGVVKGSPVYLVPRANDEIVVGASSEEVGFDGRPRAGAVYELLRDAQSLVPAISEAELVEVSTGFRPGTPDNAPLLGPTSINGLVAATGHYRNGILLTPVTADAVASVLATGAADPLLAPFAPTRFAAVPA